MKLCVESETEAQAGPHVKGGAFGACSFKGDSTIFSSIDLSIMKHKPGENNFRSRPVISHTISMRLPGNIHRIRSTEKSNPLPIEASTSTSTYRRRSRAKLATGDASSASGALIPEKFSTPVESVIHVCFV